METDSPRPLRVAWIDPHFEMRSPSMKGVIRSLPNLREQGIEIEAWTWRTDEVAERDLAKVRKLWRLPLPSPIQLFVFWPVGTLYSLFRSVFSKKPKPDVIMVTGSGSYWADASTTHFSHYDWIRCQLKLRPSNWKEAIRLPLSAIAFVLDQLQILNPRLKYFIPVSSAVGEDLRTLGSGSKKIRVFPNSYDSDRFSLKARLDNRDSAREKLGYRDDDVVLSFVSAGHYRRKGFWLAVEGIRIARERGSTNGKLLVIGGTESTLAELKGQLNKVAPGWEEWIQFTGMVDDLERWIAAADAFLLPSYSEAFALVEIEAGAMGIPLLLTRHHGSEMILKDGVNGRWLDFEPERMADVLVEEIERPIRPGEPDTGEGVDHDEYARRLGVLLREIAETTSP